MVSELRGPQAHAGSRPDPVRTGQAAALDAYRQGDSFYICLDLQGISVDSISLTVEQKVLAIRAERARPRPTAPS
jgi:HSP20 family protein